jgi:hypothetical protein
MLMQRHIEVSRLVNLNSALEDAERRFEADLAMWGIKAGKIEPHADPRNLDPQEKHLRLRYTLVAEVEQLVTKPDFREMMASGVMVFNA